MADFTVKKISPKLGGERGTRKPYGPTSSHDLVEQMEFLYVEVIQAINYNTTTVNPRGCPMVEVILGNYKSSTENLPIGPQMDWNQVFAFDKTNGDVLSVVLSVFIKQGQEIITKTLIGKRNFKLAADIPSRSPPDARMAPQWYSMKDPETGYHMDLLMSVWFGTQMDEVYSQAWFSDAYEVSASYVINTRPKLYIAPRLSLVRVTIVSAHDLLPRDGERTPLVYVKATLGNFDLKTGVSSGTNPSWNQDLLFVVSEPFEGTLFIELIDRINDLHEECMAKLKKKVSEMTPVKLPGSAPVLFHDLEIPVKVQPAGDSRRFASRIKMKLAIDQAYHVAEEDIKYSSDYRAFAKGLWPSVLGKLEIGILGATGLKGKDEKKKEGVDSYVVAKYGNRWARTRTVVNNSSPKWNEQYSWDVYDMSTVLTIGVYDNRQLENNGGHVNDIPLGKVRIPLNRVHWDWIYTSSYPIMVLGGSGLKKMGELQLAIRCISVAKWYDRNTAPLRWMYPKAHYKFPLSVYQIEQLRVQAVEVNCMNLAKTEPPLRNEVVLDMLKPKSKRFSMRIAKVNYQRLYKVALKLISPFAWFNEKIVETTEFKPKICAFMLCNILLFGMFLILLVAWYVFPLCLVYLAFRDMVKLVKMYRNKTPPPPLIINDLKLWNLDPPNLDEIDEEMDSIPTSLSEKNVLTVRYDRLRKVAANLMLLMGDAASQGERFLAIFTLLEHIHPLASICVWIVCEVMFLFVYNLWDVVVIHKFLFLIFFGLWIAFPCARNNLPNGLTNFFRRLPTDEDLF